LAPEYWQQDLLRLEGAQAHHCTDVLRLKPSSRIVVFDGCGVEVMAEITELGKDVVLSRRLFTTRANRLPHRLVLAQAVPKGRQMELIVQKATELGVSTIVPLLSERTVVQIEPSEKDHKVSRWKQIAIEAAKQCGQNWLPVIRPPVTPKAFLEERPPCELSFIGSLQEDARSFKSAFRDFQQNLGRIPSSALMLIGPEGDFTPAELVQAKSAGCIPVSLGPIVLRSETAAIYSLSVLSYELRG
jgi:16S rRNA (uracil1498-N3)-methyltransferase